MDFKDKKVLVMGLGLLGGGVATAKWLVRHGAKVTVTDLKSRRELSSSIKKLGPTPKGPLRGGKKIRFVLGRHRVEDFKNNEIIIVNPGVPRESKFLKIAEKSGALIENEASIFFRYCENPVVGVTGTRGKTTTVNWLFHILKKKFPRAEMTGNSSSRPMLAVLDSLDGKSPVVVELSSWHLELLPKSKKSPHIAVITNLYPDHLNRYPNMRSYAAAKSNIFRNQSENDFLLLNRNNAWTKFFLARKPVSRIVYFPAEVGMNLAGFGKSRGLHNFYNLNAAILVSRHFGVPLRDIKKALKTLPIVRFREEVVIRKKGLAVINDTTATTPEAGEAALVRFASDKTKTEKLGFVLIAGGTDKKLGFAGWAKTVGKTVIPRNLFLLEGSATKKMVRELKRIGYFGSTEPQVFENLPDLMKSVKEKKPAVVLFSPAATSFEKFKNEFDRGEKFNLIAKKAFSRA